LLQLEDVSVRFATHSARWPGKTRWLEAVSHVSLRVMQGQSVGLVGESGCGKSTLARAAVLLSRPQEGQVLFDNTDLLQVKANVLRRLRRRFQMIFQDPRSSLNPRMKVAQLIAEPLVIHGLAQSRNARLQKVAALIELVRLDDSVAQRFPHELSGGQRQRVAIARALACDPDLLVADEPTSALDVSVQAQIVNLLTELQAKKDLSFLFISHNLQLVSVFCHEMAVMYLGRIVERGPTAAVCRHPAHPYTQALLKAIPVHTARSTGLHALSGEVPSPIDLPAGCVFHPRCFRNDKRDACTQKRPSLIAVGKDHYCACHLVDETGTL
jgi:oligopeptide/dipeptide ABC transporter ATP-binding protein